MHRRSVVRSIPCNLKALPIGALEAFVHSHVREPVHLEEIAEVTGLELEALLRVVQRLVDLGALATEEGRRRVGRATSAPPTKSPTPGGGPSPLPRRPAERVSLVPPAVVPRASEGVNLRRMQLGPREGFVLSQIDGRTSVDELVQITHLSLESLSEALVALEAAGAAELPHRRKRAPESQPSASVRPAPVRSSSPAPPPRASGRPSRRAPGTRRPAPPSRRPPATAPARELTAEERTRIREAVARVEDADHYVALGVAREADAAAIRRAYHALAAQLHPDRFFRKNLGEFQLPLQRAFGAITLAYETLSRKARRHAYDATLAPPPEPATSPRAPPPAAGMRASGAPRPNGSARPASAKPAPSPRRATRKSMRAAPAAAASPGPAVPPSSRTPGATPPSPQDRIAAEARRREIHGRIDVFLSAAREAMARDDVVAAAQHYGLAAQNTDDPAVHRLHAEAKERARDAVYGKSLEKARAAEQASRWADAAVAYERAHGARPGPQLAERAAHALRLAGGDLRRAAQLAEQAVLAEPDHVDYRLTLAEVFLDAGLLVRAAGESRRAAALAPSDPRVRALAKRVAERKGG